MIRDSIVRQGQWFFRWRSYVLLATIPIAFMTLRRGEPIELYFGDRADFIYEGVCVALAFTGLALRAVTVAHAPKGTSGRNTRSQVAETLNTTGMYSLTRNPLYFGNAIIYMAIALFTQGVYFVIIMALFLIIYLERIIATEEAFLSDKFGTTYQEWADRVPAFFPRLSGWQAPTLPFSVRNVLRREYSGFFAIIAAFFAIEAFGDVLFQGHILYDPVWIAAFIGGGIVYLALRSLKKQTSWLDVQGR
ncbi:methyltransferase family protein [Pararhizobium haloflavum]|uniref:methyltransferase family protein n=1 Tax=Pararhizobium haloflavum TaxID=2037914 RepID=UPI000C173DB6|nr:isoprenylcysteine carboxylmethyltransferase family protein [Pararhizobium haloflavum]